MAGDSNYFDADQYVADQNKAFADTVLGANQGGVAPLPDTAATPPPEDRAGLFRRLVTAGAEMAPHVVTGPTGTIIRGVELASPGAIQSLAPRERAITSFHRDGDNPTLEGIISRANEQPFAPDPVIKAAPTLAEQARKAVGGSLAVGGGNPMGGLLADYRNAQRNQVDTMGHGADLALESGQNRATAQTQMADLRAAQAEQMRLDAERQAQIEADANARHEAFLAQSQKMADAISANNIDPTRFLRNADAKTQFIVGLGAALGGANAAANGGSNQFLDRLDGIMDRDFKTQLANADNQRSALSARNTVFGQIMAQTQDRRLADMQARDLMYTAMKNKLLSDADRLGVPEIMTQAKIAANEIENKQAALQTQIAQQSYQSAVAAAQAAAAQRAAAEKAAWERSLEIMKLNLEQQKIDKAGGEGKAKDVGERSVVLDGQDALAVNKDAAQKWNEYNHGREVFNLALQKLVTAREKGDVGAYDAARAQLIEEYPKLLGYTRAPTEGQISHTVGPNAIPEYNHWYEHAKYGPAGLATYNVSQGRAQEKIDFLKETLATSDKAMRENTFGAQAGKPPMPKSVQVVK